MDIEEITKSFEKLSIDENVIKIQKWYRGCIFRLKRLPLIMYKIQKYLKLNPIQISNHKDGRLGSCVDEDIIIKLLISKFGNRI